MVVFLQEIASSYPEAEGDRENRAAIAFPDAS